MGNNSCPLIICGFLLIIGGLLFTPNCLAARKLIDLPNNNDRGGVNNEKDYQIQSGINPSISERGPHGCVDCIFPPSAQSIATNSGNEDQNAVNNGNGVQSIVRNNGNGNRSIATNGGNGNGNGGGRRNYQGNSPSSEHGSSFSPPEYENENPNSPSTAP